MVRSAASSLSFCRRLARWLPVVGMGMMLTCGTGTGTGNAAPTGTNDVRWMTVQGQVTAP